MPRQEDVSQKVVGSKPGYSPPICKQGLCYLCGRKLSELYTVTISIEMDLLHANIPVDNQVTFFSLNIFANSGN